jgi:hypothetical protein
MIYKVTKQYSGGKEQPCKQFKHLNEAKIHAEHAIEESAAMKIKVIYRIYEFDDLLETLDSSTIQPASSSSSESGNSSGGKQSGATFKPTPFEMAPRPGGTPPKWLIDPEEDDKNKDK